MEPLADHAGCGLRCRHSAGSAVPEFGAESYRAFDIRTVRATTVTALVQEIERLLRNDYCWPSQAKRGAKPTYAAASSLTFRLSRHWPRSSATYRKKGCSKPILSRCRTFIATTAGSIVGPVEVYIRSDELVAVLGEAAPSAVGWPDRDLKKLGCRSDPRADDVIGYLTELRESGSWPGRPRLLYDALAAALRHERRPTDAFRSQQILWTRSSWEAPDDCLVGEANRKVFVVGVPVLPDSWRDFDGALGAHAKPADSHEDGR